MGSRVRDIDHRHIRIGASVSDDRRTVGFIVNKIGDTILVDFPDERQAFVIDACGLFYHG